jgi:hypothetical protein
VIGGYRRPEDLRRALEARLHQQGLQEGVPLDRLRKEAAFARLLARFVTVNVDTWALKGGLALIWRTGDHLRATRDVDANWRDSEAQLDRFLTAVESGDLDDGFEFELGDPKPLEGEAETGARRYSVRALMAGRLFEQFPLDVNVVPDDPRPVEAVTISRNPFVFANVDALTIPMMPIEQQLAEKLHACVRHYADGMSSRSKDAFDTVIIAALVAVPDADALRVAVAVTFTLRGTAVPRSAPILPGIWEAELAGYLAEYPIAVAESPRRLLDRFAEFWNPVLADTSPAAWDPKRWSWSSPT